MIDAVDSEAYDVCSGGGKSIIQWRPTGISSPSKVISRQELFLALRAVVG